MNNGSVTAGQPIRAAVEATNSLAQGQLLSTRLVFEKTSNTDWNSGSSDFSLLLKRNPSLNFMIPASVLLPFSRTTTSKSEHSRRAPRSLIPTSDATLGPADLNLNTRFVMHEQREGHPKRGPIAHK